MNEEINNTTQVGVDITTLSQLIPSITKGISDIIVKDDITRMATKERFNIFSSLPNSHYEKLHSNMIAYLLDPNADHDCGDVFLRLFFEVIDKNLKDEKSKNRLANFIESKCYHVHKEYYLGNSNHTVDYGYIDILLEFEGKSYILIENKVEADEQLDQLKRYISSTIIKHEHNILFYLTPYGKESRTHQGLNYIIISYKEHIMDWLNLCVKETWKYPNVSFSINQYREIVRKKVLGIETDKVQMEIKKLLENDRNWEIIKYLDAIDQARIELHKDLLRLLLESLITKLSKYKSRFIKIGDAITDLDKSTFINGPENSIIILDEIYSLEISEIQTVNFVIEHNDTELYFGLFIFERDGNSLISSKSISKDTLFYDKFRPYILEKYQKQLIYADGTWELFKQCIYCTSTKDLLIMMDEKEINEIDKENFISGIYNQIIEYLDFWEIFIKTYQNVLSI